jgi:hypothetical protein
MRVTPYASVLGALLAGWVNCRDLEMGKEVAKKLFEIEPENTGNYILLANMYTSHGRLEVANELRRQMMAQELRKAKGCTFVTNKNQTTMVSSNSKQGYDVSGIMDTSCRESCLT